MNTMENAPLLNNSAVALFQPSGGSNGRGLQGPRYAEGMRMLKKAVAAIQCELRANLREDNDQATPVTTGALMFAEVRPSLSSALGDLDVGFFSHFFTIASHQRTATWTNLRDQPTTTSFLGHDAGCEEKVVHLAVCLFNQALFYQIRCAQKLGGEQDLLKAGRLYQLVHNILSRRLGVAAAPPMMTQGHEGNIPSPTGVLLFATCTNMVAVCLEMADMFALAQWQTRVRQWLPAFHPHQQQQQLEEQCSPERSLYRLAHLAATLEGLCAARAA